MTKRSNETGSRASRLRQLLTSKDITILMEAHNGLSAKLAAEAGFKALWASGLSISAALGVRDSNEASWTQVLEVLEFMNDASDLPILLDGDTGYGNFNNARRLVRKLEQRGIAGVCLEDKLFPKTNSFISGEKQALAAVDEFCGKLRAVKDTQIDPSFVLVARTEAFIAGWGLEEALRRANAYAESGADFVLVHSKRSDSNEVIAFMKHWDNRVPVVIVPTKYPSEPLAKLARAGVTNFIFANHALRSVVAVLQRNLRILRDTQDLLAIENDIVPVSEVFRLQNVEELKGAEERYLPASARDEVSALVLTTARAQIDDDAGAGGANLTRLRGNPILSRQVETLRAQGIRQITAAGGRAKGAVELGNVSYCQVGAPDCSSGLGSLHAARDALTGDVVIAYGDVVFDQFVLDSLLRRQDGIGIVVDVGRGAASRDGGRRFSAATTCIADASGEPVCRLRGIGPAVQQHEATGTWIGLLYVPGAKIGLLLRALDELVKDAPELLQGGDLAALLGRLLASGEDVSVVHTYGHWYQVGEQKDEQPLRSEQVAT